MPDLPQILSDVLDRPDSERSAFLDGACGNNASLRADVEALIEAHEKADAFLAEPLVTRPAVDATVGTALSEGPGTVIDKYKLLQLIGEGGFGAVYMAEQQKPVKRRVALKIIKLGMDTKQVIARFEAERQALAMMNHPNIATVLDAGATETGRPYFVMELVKGIPITEYCDQNNLTVHARLDLFKLVCAAVQHAHQKGIIHRDIKPSNVMVTLHDGKPVPKVIDFGIAKAMNRELTDKTLFTEYRQLIGTPQYMSPEQAEMSGLDIDTRSDIYALGVLLYELLTGTTPFDPKRLREAGLNEIQRIIREEEPHKPSTRLSTLDTLESIAAHRGIEPRKLGLQIRGDLDWIIMKALEKDRTRRYDTAAGFAADVQRHLDDEPVVAGPPSAGYRLRKFVRRNRTGVMTACAVLSVLLVGIAGTSVGLLRARAAELEQSRAREEAVLARDNEAEQRRIAEAAEQEQNRARQEAVLARDDAEKQKQQAEEATREALRQSYVSSLRGTQASIQANEIRGAKVLLDQAPAELRGWEWKYLHAQLDQSLAVLRGHETWVSEVAFSPDGKRIVSRSGNNTDNTLRLWDAMTGDELVVLRGHDEQVNSVVFSPDGSRIVSGSSDKTVRLWDASNGKELAVLRGHEDGVRSVAFSPDGTRIASGSGDNTVRLWDAGSHQQLAVLAGGPAARVKSVVFSPDGSRILSDAPREVRLWDAASHQELGVFRKNSVASYEAGSSVPVMNGFLLGTSAAFSPDGSRIAAGMLGRIVLLDAASGDELTTFSHESETLGSVYHILVAFSPDGSRIASWGPETVILWDAATGKQFAVLRGHEDGVRSVVFSPDGTRIATGSWDKTVRLWDAATGEELAVLLGHENGVNSVAFSPDGTRIASGSYDDTVRLWDATALNDSDLLRRTFRSFALSPDGSRIATVSWGRVDSVRLWDVLTGDQLAVLARDFNYSARCVAYSPDGSRIAVGMSDKTVRMWDATTGEGLGVLRGHEDSVTSVAFSPDGSRIASGSQDKTLRVWDASSGVERLVLRGHADWIVWVAFSPDGSQIASGSSDKTVRLWDTSTGDKLLVLHGHNAGVNSAAFSPDGSQIASASDDETVRLWNAASGEELAVLRRHESWVQAVAFSPDGSRIVSGAYDNTLRLWDAATGGELAILRLGGRPETDFGVTSAAFSPDGTRIVSVDDESGTLRLWDAVANAQRYQERTAYRKAESLMNPVVDRLFAEDAEPGRVVASIRNDSSLNEVQRHVALNLVLQRSALELSGQNQRNYLDDMLQHGQADDLNRYASGLLTVEPVEIDDAKAALSFALRACELSDYDDPMILDTLALAYHLTGDHAKAVETQKKAIALLTPDIPNRDEYEDHLAQFKAALPKE